MQRAEPAVVHVTRESGIPLLGCIAFGIIDRGTNVVQVRATTVCNMNCAFCSTDGGPYSAHHKTHFMVDVEYLAGELARVVRVKGDNIIVFLDSVGEPLCHPDFVRVVEGVRKIPSVSRIVVITNGTLLTKEKVGALEQAGLDQLNVSVHATDADVAKTLFGMPSYDVQRVLDMLGYVKEKTKMEVMVTPVWLPGVNDREVEKVIAFCKETGCLIGVQKYEVYPFSRRMKSAKVINYWKFRRQLEAWEKQYGVPLVLKREDVHVETRPRIPDVFKVGERVHAVIVAPGWYPGQMLAAAKGRCISVVRCAKRVGDRVNVRLVETKNNLYVAEEA